MGSIAGINERQHVGQFLIPFSAKDSDAPPLHGRRREQLTWSGSGSGGVTLVVTLKKCQHAISPVIMLWWTSSSAGWSDPAWLRHVRTVIALMLNTNLSISLPRIPSDYHQQPITNVTVTIYAAMLQGILTFRESVPSCIHFHLQ